MKHIVKKTKHYPILYQFIKFNNLTNKDYFISTKLYNSKYNKACPFYKLIHTPSKIGDDI